MTDTGQVPGEGQPENAGGHPGQPQPAAAPSPADAGPTELPGMVPAPGAYPYPGQPEDDDLLLMPGTQGAWSEQPAPQPYPQPQETHHGADQQPQQGAPFDAAAQGTTGFEPMPAQAGDHESGGRDSGSVDLGSVRIPQPAAPQPDRARAAAPATPPRRPLHMGPPVPDATGGVVRSLADRGPAEVPTPSAARHAGPPTGGPEYFDAPAAATPDEQLVTGSQAEAQSAADLPYAEQPPGEAPAGQTFAAPSYGEQPYGGQLHPEQAYGAAGQGPLPGPQLGEIPSQVPQWNQAAAAPFAETVAPEAPAAPAEAVQPAPQDAALPVEQPMPLPAEDAAQPVDGAPAAGAAAAGQEAQAEAPMQPQDGAAETVPEAVPDAAPAGQDGTARTDAAVVAGAAPGMDTADGPVADVPGGQEAHGQEAPGQEVPAQAAPAADAVAPEALVQDASAQVPAAAQQAEAVAAEVPQQPAEEPAQNAPGEPEAQAPTQPADAPEPAPAPSDAAGPTVEPVAEQPAVDAPAEALQAPQDEPSAGQTAEPEQSETAAEAVAEAVATEPQPEPTADAPAEPAPDQPTPPEATDATPAADPTAPQGPVDLPATDNGAPEEQAVIEPPEEQQPAPGEPQPGAPTDAARPAEEPTQEATDTPVGRQPAAPAPDDTGTPAEPLTPVAEAPPAEPAENAASTEDTASATAAEPTEPAEVTPDALAEGPDEARPVTVHIPAQASGEHTPVDAPAPQAPAPEGEPTADSDETPQQQDAAALVQLGEGQDGDQPQAADEQDPARMSAVADSLLSPAAGYDDSERAAVHRVIRERRDIRNGFRSDPIPHDVLLRVLEAAHTAPSVGHSQPWDFVVIRSDETREKMHQLAMAQREAYAKSLPKARAKQFRELKIEAILETPVNIVVTADSTRGGRHTLGRHTQPQMAPYSSALAVENLWLAARAEGLGVGWVSFFDEREMVRELGLPEHLEVVAYLCIGYVDEFPEDPELLQAGWSKRRPLSWVVHEETYGRRALPGESPHDLLQETLQGIRPLDAKALGEAWERQKRMTKPAGALGMLEIISAQLSGLSRKCPPPIPEPAAVAIFAGDHGVHAQGVTPWPQEVTGQMVANFLGGGAVCNAFANQVGAEVCVVDVGVAGDLPATPGLLPRKVRAGTADFTAGPAMTQEDVLKAIEVGIDTARDLVAAGNKALLTGEMGIANTTTSAALISVYTGDDPAEVTGRGTGINDETHARKVDVVRRALELHQPDPADPIGVLAAIGGLEHAALVGLILGGASLRTPVILDGVSAGAAALVARAIAPEALAACIAGHRSAEPGHVAALNKLGLRPLVDLDLRLGEGTGALLALPVVQSAARAMHEVATFDSAGVTEKT
ncbi:nicotinate-nucleotide--dimethylbenzimidazole phosphoribosyltransferase [Streptomyces tubercidicus]|uniref:nicotinate-nucleotide--dimethylbenzimidazole phosphoribosyltransferase n=1 Tax=Streptomyces tubercidicus TaxID=47759 RepID=UPI002E177A16